MKMRIFVDFWNFQLSLNDHTNQDYRMDWKKLSPLLGKMTSELLGEQITFEETRVYMSYDSRKESDKRLKNWATNVLDRFPGVSVTLRERKQKKIPYCQNCHNEIPECPNCGHRIVRTIEKGIDTAIVTDLVTLAWEEAWDVAVLLSSDRDFIPAVELLAVKGYRVINAHFPPLGMDLARKCWASIDMIKHIEELKM